MYTIQVLVAWWCTLHTLFADCDINSIIVLFYLFGFTNCNINQCNHGNQVVTIYLCHTPPSRLSPSIPYTSDELRRVLEDNFLVDAIGCWELRWLHHTPRTWCGEALGEANVGTMPGQRVTLAVSGQCAGHDNTRRWTNAGLVLDNRLRPRPSIEPQLIQGETQLKHDT